MIFSYRLRVKKQDRLQPLKSYTSSDCDPGCTSISRSSLSVERAESFITIPLFLSAAAIEIRYQILKHRAISGSKSGPVVLSPAVC